MTILAHDSDAFATATEGLATVSTKGTLVQTSSADVIGHWAEQLEDQIGFSIESLLDVKLIDVEQRIDLALSKEGFKLEVVPLGTNYLSYQILDNKAGTPAPFPAKYNGGFDLEGQAQDFAYLDLFGDIDIGTRDFFIKYEGMMEVKEAGPTTFDFRTIGGFTLMVDGEVVVDADPGAAGVQALDLAPGWHQIEILVEHDPLIAESPTARHDDDLIVKVGFGDDKPGDMFDHVRTTPDTLFEVEATVTVGEGDAAQTHSLHFFAPAIEDIRGYIDAAMAKVIVADGAAVSYDVTWTTEVTVTEADNYTVSGDFGPDAAELTMDGAPQTLSADGEGAKGSLRLPAGGHEVSLNLSFDSKAAWDAGDLGLEWKGKDTGGRTVTIGEEGPALTDGFFDTLNGVINSVGDWIAESGMIPLDIGPIVATPTLTFSLGIDAEMGWDITLPGLGRTITSLPVTFDLESSSIVETGGKLTAMVTNLQFLAPNTKSYLLEMGSADFTADFELPETQLKDVGFFIGTSSVAEELVEEIFGEDSGLARLNSALNDLVTFELKLDKAISLDEITGAVDAAAEASGARDPEKAFDIEGFLDGLYSGRIDLSDTLSQLIDLIGNGDFHGAFELFYQVAGIGHDIPEEEKTGKEELTVKDENGNDVALTPAEVLELTRAAALFASEQKGEDTTTGGTGDDTTTGGTGDDTTTGGTGDDTTTGGTGDDTTTGGTGDDTTTGGTGDDTTTGGTGDDTTTGGTGDDTTTGGTGDDTTTGGGGDDTVTGDDTATTEAEPTLSIVNEAFGTVRVAVSTVENLLKDSGLPDLFEALNTLFTKGYEIMPGLTVSGDLSIGKAFDHYGWDGQLDDDVAPADDARDEATQIVSETTVKLLSVSADVREMYFGAAMDAIDKQLAREDLTAAERKQLTNAKIAASLQPLMLEVMEEGASAELTLNQAPVLHAVTDIFLGLIDDLTGGINAMVDFFVPGDFDGITTDLVNNETINMAFEDPDQFEVLTREALEPVAEFLKTVPGYINDFIKEIGSAFVEETVDTSRTVLTEAAKAWLVENITAYHVERGVAAEDIRFDFGANSFSVYDTGTKINPQLGFFTEQGAYDYAQDHRTELAAIGVTYSGGFGADLAQVLAYQFGLDVADVMIGATTTNGLFTVSDGGTLVEKELDLGNANNPNVIDIYEEQLGFPAFTGTAGEHPTTVKLVGWLQTVIDVAADVAGAVVSDDVIEALASTIDGILTAVDAVVPDSIASPEDYVADALRLLGFEFSRDEDDYLTVHRDSGLFGMMKDAQTFPDEVRGFADTLTDFFVNGVEMNWDDAINAMMDDLAGFIPAMMKSITASADLDLNLFEMTAGADLNLTQITTFNPEDVMIEYTWGDQTIIAAYGDAVQFDVPDTLEDETPEVTARLIFDGAYDYEYVLSPDFNFDFEMFGFSVLGELTHGGDIIFSDTIEYALIKTTDDIVDGDTLSRFDDAVIEIDSRAIQEKMTDLFDALIGAPIRAVLGDDDDSEPGRISLGTITDVQIEEDIDGHTFTPVGAKTTVTVVLTEKPQDLTGDETDNALTGAAGNDTLTGLGGADTLKGLSGDDSLDGGAGDDLLFGGAGADTIIGGEGIDTLAYSELATATEAQAQEAILPTDTVIDTGVTVDLAAGTATGTGTGSEAEGDVLSGIEHVIGTAANDSLTGDAGDNRLGGVDGDDTLDGGEGDDTLQGGAGADSMVGGAGRDRATYWASGEGVVVSLVTGEGSGGYAAGDRLSGIEILSGSDHADHLTGDALANSLMGQAGDDTLAGGAGGDQLRGGAGADLLDGGDGIDRAVYQGSAAGVIVNLISGTGRGGDAAGDRLTGIENVTGSDQGDTLIGDAGKNALTGGAGDDTLKGGAGHDTLTGGAGDDLLQGGAGRDAFVFNVALEDASKAAKVNGEDLVGAGVDRIADFSVADDTIRLGADWFTGLAEGALSAQAFSANAAGLARDASDRIVYETDTGKLFFDADGKGGDAGGHFATLSAGLALTAADFFVF